MLGYISTCYNRNNAIQSEIRRYFQDKSSDDLRATSSDHYNKTRCDQSKTLICLVLLRIHFDEWDLYPESTSKEPLFCATDPPLMFKRTLFYPAT